VIQEHEMGRRGYAEDARFQDEKVHHVFLWFCMFSIAPDITDCRNLAIHCGTEHSKKAQELIPTQTVGKERLGWCNC